MSYSSTTAKLVSQVSNCNSYTKSKTYQHNKFTAKFQPSWAYKEFLFTLATKSSFSSPLIPSCLMNTNEVGRSNPYLHLTTKMKWNPKNPLKNSNSCLPFHLRSKSPNTNRLRRSQTRFSGCPFRRGQIEIPHRSLEIPF